jgi:hypothetical protein
VIEAFPDFHCARRNLLLAHCSHDGAIMPETVDANVSGTGTMRQA